MPISINSINASIHGFISHSAPVTPYEMVQNGEKQSKRRQEKTSNGNPEQTAMAGSRQCKLFECRPVNLYIYLYL